MVESPAIAGAASRRWLMGAGLAALGIVATLVRLRPGAEDKVEPDWPERPASASQGTFPALTVQRIDGSPDLLPVGTGGVRLVNFWARWCGPCRRELPSLQRLRSRLEAASQGTRIEVQALALDDDSFALREYLRDLRLDALPVWRLPADQRPTGLALDKLPLSFVVAADGSILARIVGAREWDRDEHLSRLVALARQPARGG